MGYMQDFLFDPERARAPINKLSGGERNRLLLAKLFTKTANVLVLDEPTNDLDVETLELLEYTLLSFTGTVLMVSHDREFIDNIATSTIVLEGNGQLSEYVGGYSDYLSYAATQPGAGKTNSIRQKRDKPPTPVAEKSKPAKLSYKLQRELDILPVTIEKLEKKKDNLEEKMADPEIYKDADKLKTTQTDYSHLETELATAYTRWEELEAQANQNN